MRATSCIHRRHDGAGTGIPRDRVLVNGISVSAPLATRAYRLRLLNGNADLQAGVEDGTPLTVIGTDGGLLQPIQQACDARARTTCRVILDLSGRDVEPPSSCEARRFRRCCRCDGHDGDANGAWHGDGPRHGRARCRLPRCRTERRCRCSQFG
jgi:hypothetical protein